MLCLPFLIVPTVPRNFTLQNIPDEPNQLLASWMEPKPPNGVITSYSVTCTLSINQVAEGSILEMIYKSEMHKEPFCSESSLWSIITRG